MFLFNLEIIDEQYGTCTPRPAFLVQARPLADQVAAILKTIQAEAEPGSRTRALAGAGLHISTEMRELGRSWRDDVRRNGV